MESKDPNGSQQSPQSSQLDLLGVVPAVSTEKAREEPEKIIAAASRELGQESLFKNAYEFLDDVHGPIYLNRIEVDAVDSPEFQRLFRLGQLGFVDLVFPTANHTRATHSIGACHYAKRLVRALNANRKGLGKNGAASVDPPPYISDAEKVLISLAGLVHDLPHGPFSHDIEKKTHYVYPPDPSDPDKVKRVKIKSFYGPYEKHDNFEENPALYVFLTDVTESVLARILRKHSPAFAQLLMGSDLRKHPHLADFVQAVPSLWPDYAVQILPSLLFHLLVWEKPEEEARISSREIRTSFTHMATSKWGLGPKKNWERLHRAWYQPFRHDIVGDTLSADLLDYLVRDQSRLGMKNELDLKLLKNYVLVPWNDDRISQGGPGMYRCAIDLMDHKRGTFRAERLNDLFRLLDLRHQIHEKAVYHRVVQSAIAMLSRAALMLKPHMPDLHTLYGLDGSTLALAGDDGFLQHLVAVSQRVEGPNVHQSLACKLAERRVYRPLMVVPGDRINVLLRGICDFRDGLEHPLRELAAIIDSPFFSRLFLLISTAIETLLRHAFRTEDEVDGFLQRLSADRDHLVRVSDRAPKRVIFWTTPYKQLYKDPAILVCGDDGLTCTIEDLQRKAKSEALRARVKAGISDAETKNEALWKFYVFLSDGLFYTGALARAIPDHPCAVRPQNHEAHLLMAQNLVVRALRTAWLYWQARKRTVDLRQACPFDDLVELLKVFGSTSVLFRLGDKDIPHATSGVRVDQYLHSDGAENCRDVRYKFDLSRDLKAVLDSAVPVEKREVVSQAVRAIGLDPTQVMGEEMAEIVSRLATASAEDLTNLVQLASRNRPASEEILISLWRSELA